MKNENYERWLESNVRVKCEMCCENEATHLLMVKEKATNLIGEKPVCLDCGKNELKKDAE